MASSWVAIATAIAEKHGVENDLFVRDRIGSINEDNLNGGAIKAIEFSSGAEAVQLGGRGIGGNAVARFGEDDVAGRTAAQEFAAVLTALKDLDLLDDVLVLDEFNFANLAKAAGATTAHDRVSSIRDDVDLSFAVKMDSDGQFAIRGGGDGVGGNFVAKFVDEGDARAFADLANTLEDLGFQDELFL